VRTREAHEGAVSGLAFSRDGKLLATGGNDRRVRLWDAHTAREVHALGRLARPVAQVLFSPDGKRLVAVGRPSEEADQAIEVLLWDTASGKKVAEIPGQAGPALDAGFGPDGKRLLLAVPGKGLVIWDLESGKAVDRLDDLPEAPRAQERAVRLSASPDGRRLALAGVVGLTVYFRDAGPAGEVWRRTEITEPVASVTGLAWAPRGNLLLVGSPKNVRVLDCVNRKVTGIWTGLYPDPRSMTVSADPRRVVSGLGVKGAAVWEYPPKRVNRPLLILRHEGGETTYLAASPDGRLLAAGTANGELIFWDAPGAAVAAAPR
jgi:WD40 repeat protein